MNNLITKSTIIYEDCILGQVTISSLIEFLESIYNDCSKFEDMIIDILQKQHFDDDTIYSLLNLNHGSGIKLVIAMLNSLE